MFYTTHISSIQFSQWMGKNTGLMFDCINAQLQLQLVFIRENGQQTPNNFRIQQMCLVVRQPTHSTAMAHEMPWNMWKMHRQASSAGWEICSLVLIKYILWTEHRKNFNHYTPSAHTHSSNIQYFVEYAEWDLCQCGIEHPHIADKMAQVCTA
jgi:hypothetical protein